MKMPSREWFMKKIAEEPEGEIGVGFEIGFRDMSEVTEIFRTALKVPYDPEDDKNNPNLFRYTEDQEDKSS